MSDQNKESPGGAEDGDKAPDVGFSLPSDGAAEPSGPSEDVAAESRDRALARQIADALGAVGPPGWRQLDAVFVLTTTTGVAEVVYTDSERSMRAEPPSPVLEQARAHRALVAESDGEPYWRLLVRLSSEGEFEVDYDFGDEPFPEGQLFDPEAYRADLEEYPRETLPVWLAAYIGHGHRQTRSPQDAAIASRADKSAKVWPVLAENEFPDFPEMWARWSCISAAFVAARSDWGPRVLPSMGWFESSRRGGATLYSLPNDRAVLSGGIWEAPNLHATYNDGANMPKFFAGAPDWVATPVLNPRAATGLMSFAYWWEGGRWYRGDSPAAEQCATAVPGVWTANTTVGIVAGLAGQPPNAEQRSAAASLISAAEVGVVTRETLVNLFGDDGRFDIDGAMYQLALAGVVASLPEPMLEEEAIFRVRGYIEGRGLDTTGYPLDQLVGDRFSCGWMVYVPVPSGEISIGRAIFYIADDGVLEHSSSSTAPTTFVKEFEQRFQNRQGAQ
ncbi:hypothetical protein [Nocardia sp. NBC_01329]|uniref:hypothetical protein n=1 Tax=Nocardia sp. NBC_01329 TaxID=2903594 RepID=UPI002E0F87B5|nr:hypothetical protein OG405_14855 [Nocardia sp. NBC_01329]